MTGLPDMEVLRVKPGERLILRLSPGATPQQIEDARAALNDAGIGARCVLMSADIQLAVVEPEPAS